MRYRDIAIVTNAMSAYEKGLKGILSEAGIPCFVDSRRDISSHPLILLVNSLLECVVYDFRYEAVFSYLKTGLTPMAQEDMDILENYVLAYGIKGYKWKKDVWTYGFQPGREAEQAYLNDLRVQVMTPFAPLLALKRKKNLPLRDWVTALVVQLDTLGIAQKRQLFPKQPLPKEMPPKPKNIGKSGKSSWMCCKKPWKSWGTRLCHWTRLPVFCLPGWKKAPWGSFHDG